MSVRDEIAKVIHDDLIDWLGESPITMKGCIETAKAILAIKVPGKTVALKHVHHQTPGDIDTCLKCGKDIRNTIHLKAGESWDATRPATIVDLTGADNG